MIEKFLGTYSNGWGHLIATSVIFVSMALLLAGGKVPFGTFEAIVSPVLLFWFGTGIANRIAQVKNENPGSPNSPLVPQTQPTTPPMNAPMPVETEAPTLVLKTVKGKKNAT